MNTDADWLVVNVFSNSFFWVVVVVVIVGFTLTIWGNSREKNK